MLIDGRVKAWMHNSKYITHIKCNLINNNYYLPNSLKFQSVGEG